MEELNNGERAQNESMAAAEPAAEPAAEREEAGKHIVWDEGPQEDWPQEQEESGAGQPAENAPQSEGEAEAHPKTDAEWKAARLKKQQELEAVARQAAAAEAARRDEGFAKRFAGHANPVTGAPIRSEREYLEALDAQQQLENEQRLQSSGVGVETLNAAIAANPMVQKALEAERRETRDKWNGVMDTQIKGISQLDASIQCFEDLPKMPNYAQFDRLARRGVDLVTAYKAANFDTLSQKSAAAARQAAINRSRALQHLERSGGAGGLSDLAEIPSEDSVIWAEMFPDSSPEERRRKYNRAMER